MTQSGLFFIHLFVHERRAPVTWSSVISLTSRHCGPIFRYLEGPLVYNVEAADSFV